MTEPTLPFPAWDAGHAERLDEPGRLLYRSNLLGSDKRVTNFGGGNTSAKIPMQDPLTGETVQVMWVKGSGGDIGTRPPPGTATTAYEPKRPHDLKVSLEY